MKIHVLLSPLNVDELYFTGKTTVVIDVLRATTTIITALNNGAREVVPVNSIEFAMKVSGNSFGGQTLLGGERNTKKIEGFTLGNSPLEYTREAIEGKSLILFTTNGTKATVKAKFSENLFLLGFNNLEAVAKHLASLNKDVEILCAGSNGMFCIEDTICAGKLIEKIEELSGKLELSDSAKACVTLANSSDEDMLQMLRGCEHGKLLIENGFEDDLNYVADLNTIDAVPYFDAGVVKLIPSDEKNKNDDNN